MSSKPKLLPGGSITQFQRKPDSAGLDPGSQTPDIPTLVQEIEMNPVGTLNMVWPISDLSLLDTGLKETENYMDQLKALKAKPYNHLVWGAEAKNILVMGYGAGGQYQNGVYCINLSMMIGEWKKKKEKLISKLQDLDIINPSTQALLRQLWVD